MNEDNLVCKHCGSSGIVKFGTYEGVQRYWCKICKRKFKDYDTTFHMKTDANPVSSALNMYYEGMSIKAIRRHLLQGFNNAPSTAIIYEWIMKYTQYATDSIKGYKPPFLIGMMPRETLLVPPYCSRWWALGDSSRTSV